jgi:hypothetical protein
MISAGVIDSKSLSSVIAGMDWSACRDRLVAGRRIASGSSRSHFSSLRDSLAGAFKCYATQIAVIHYPTALL